MKFFRLTALAVALIAALFIAWRVGFIKPKPKPTPLEFTFAHVSESHLISYTSTGEAKAREEEYFASRKLTYATEIWGRIAKQVERQGAKFIIHTGDVFDFVNEKTPQLLSKFHEASPLPLYAAPGNHDYLTLAVDDKGEAQWGRTQEYSNLWRGNDWRILIIHEVVFIFLNKWREEGIGDEQLAGLQELLNEVDTSDEYQDLPVVIAMHRPLWNPVTVSQGFERFLEPNSEAFCEALNGRDNIVAILGGHVHVPSISKVCGDITQFIAPVGYRGRYFFLKYQRKVTPEGDLTHAITLLQ